MGWASAMAVWPTLETERLLLRKLRMEDAADIFEYASDPLVTCNVLIATHQSLNDSQALLERILSRGPDSGHATFGLVLKKTDKLIGTCSIFLDDERSARADV